MAVAKTTATPHEGCASFLSSAVCLVVAQTTAHRCGFNHPKRPTKFSKEKKEILERETGIEPATNGLGSRYSTIELLPPAAKSLL
jgi:hypothetical protein